MKGQVRDGAASVTWVPTEREYAAVGYDGQPIGLFPASMQAAKAIGGNFPDVLRAALEAESTPPPKAAHVAVPARFKPPAPEPAPEPETAVGGGEAVAEPKPLPVVHVSAGHIAEGRRRTATPAEVRAFVEQLHHPAAEPADNARYWFEREGWWVCAHPSMSIKVGPFETFDAAVRARFRSLT